MVARGGGHIVFMSSLAGKAGRRGGSLYSATKFGLRGFALGPARGPARRRASASRRSSPASSATRACSPTPASSCRAASAPKRPRTSRRPSCSAIERDRGEVDVAPCPLRAGAVAAGLAPQTAATVQRRLGGEQGLGRDRRGPARQALSGRAAPAATSTSTPERRRPRSPSAAGAARAPQCRPRARARRSRPGSRRRAAGRRRRTPGSRRSGRRPRRRRSPRG